MKKKNGGRVRPLRGVAREPKTFLLRPFAVTLIFCVILFLGAFFLLSPRTRSGMRGEEAPGGLSVAGEFEGSGRSVPDLRSTQEPITVSSPLDNLKRMPSGAPKEKTPGIPAASASEDENEDALPHIDFGDVEAELKLLREEKNAELSKQLGTGLSAVFKFFLKSDYAAAARRVERLARDAGLDLTAVQCRELEALAVAMRELAESDACLASVLSKKVGRNIRIPLASGDVPGRLLSVSKRERMIELEIIRNGVKMIRRVRFGDITADFRLKLLESSDLSELSLQLLKIACGLEKKKKVDALLSELAALNGVAAKGFETAFENGRQTRIQIESEKLFRWLLTMDKVRLERMDLSVLRKELAREVRSESVLKALMGKLEDYYAETALRRIMDDLDPDGDSDVRLSFLNNARRLLAKYESRCVGTAYCQNEGRKLIRAAIGKLSVRFERKFTVARRVDALGLLLIPCRAGAVEYPDSTVEVEISNPFWISAKPITVWHYVEIMKTLPNGAAAVHSPRKRPVVNVSFNQAARFCRLLTRSAVKRLIIPEGYEYRLPTLAELALAVSSKTIEMPAFRKGKKLESKTESGARSLPSEFWCADWHAWEPPKNGSVNPSGPPVGVSKVVARRPEGTLKLTKSFESPSAAFKTLGFRMVLGRPL